jgi:hypothetical protein
VFLDTFVDHDRGYYPRHGLLDRRYNPRPGYYVLYHLRSALGGDRHALHVTRVDAPPGIRAFALQNAQHCCALLLLDQKTWPGEIVLPGSLETRARDGIGKWLDLETGQTTKVRWRRSLPDSAGIAFDPPSTRLAPALLIFEDSGLGSARPSGW